MAEFPYLYRNSYAEARRFGETQAHEDSWEACSGFGCSPTASGRAVYATCLGDGENARWDRSDFIGVLKDEFLPDWARTKLEELHPPEQKGPSMDGMS